MPPLFFLLPLQRFTYLYFSLHPPSPFSLISPLQSLTRLKAGLSAVCFCLGSSPGSACCPVRPGRCRRQRAGCGWSPSWARAARAQVRSSPLWTEGHATMLSAIWVPITWIKGPILHPFSDLGFFGIPGSSRTTSIIPTKKRYTSPENSFNPLLTASCKNTVKTDALLDLPMFWRW